MSDKFVFQNARIKSMESKLLNSQSLQRLTDCSSTLDAFKLLQEIGFGAGISVENNNFDALFEQEEKNSFAVVKNFNVDGALDVFLLTADYHNLKALLKAHITNQQHPVLMPDGLFDANDLKEAIITGDLSNLRFDMQESVKKVLKLISDEKVTPHAIDTMVDKAMYQDILKTVKKSGKLAKLYFVRKIDFTNIMTFLRCKKLELNEKFFEESFICGGELNLEFFGSIYENAIETLKEKCKYTPYFELVAKTIDSQSLIDFEVESDNFLLKMWKDNFNDMFSIAPIVSFYLTKATELKLAKLIVAGIKNKVDPKLIKERMREIYA